MLCTYPFFKDGIEFGCGRCLPCRINKRREWTARLMLESQCHENSSFVTLTYSNDNLPSDFSVNLRDYQLFMKRLRKNTGLKLRYFIAGEYGDNTWRPHYHLVLFGFISPVAALF